MAKEGSNQSAMWLSFSFSASGDQQEILMALLNSIGFEGFEQKENLLIGFVPAEKFSESEFRELIQPLDLAFEKSEVAEENWNEEWEKNFQPIVIENKIAVRASFHSPVNGVEQEIIIDPKMAFGTGHHATTEMMMRLILEENFSGKTVLDFGCGTGILSILAAKLGAATVLAIDNDPNAVENSRENFQLNRIGNAAVMWGDTVPAGEKFDFILANVTKEVIMENLRAYSAAMENRGSLFISGLLFSDRSPLMNAVNEAGLVWEKEYQMDQWMGVKCMSR